MRITRHLLRFMAVAGTCSTAFAEAPSFDCRKATNALAATICASPDASAADWELVSAYWAAYATKEGAVRTSFRDAHVAWLKSLDGRCGLSGRTSGQEARAACVADQYRGRAADYRDGLSGDARLEAGLSADQHRRVQAGLSALGYPNQGEGIFGASTREGIEAYQTSLGQEATGFLNRRQLAGLLGGAGRDRQPAAPQAARPQDPDAAAAQALMMGMLGGFARSQGIPIPQPYVQPRPGAAPPSPGRRLDPMPQEDEAEGLAEGPKDDRFGDRGSVAFSPTRPQSTASPDGLRTVEVTGSGDNVEEAKADASRQAVQKVAGLYVDARRKVETKVSDAHVTDVVEEKIVSYTNAYVKKVDVLDTRRDGSLITVRERVSVAVGPLIKVLQDNAVPTVAFDTDSAAGTVTSLAAEKQGAMDMYADLLGRAASLVTVGVGKPEVDATLPSGPAESWLSIPVTFKVNSEARQEWRSKFRLFANERGTIHVPTGVASIVGSSGRADCRVPVNDLTSAFLNQNRSFLNESVQGGERGVAACFLDAGFDGAGEAECYGRRFVIDQRSTFDPCPKSGPCLFLKERTKKVHLVFEMTDKDGGKVLSAVVPFNNFPAINVRASVTHPSNGAKSFFNYCVPRQTGFYQEESRDYGPARYGDVLLFPAEGSQLRAYYNALVPNEKIERIASISARLVQDE